MLIFIVYKWQRTWKVWLDGNFDILVARDVEEKTDEFYKYVNTLYCNTCRRIFFLIMPHTYSVFLVLYCSDSFFFIQGKAYKTRNIKTGQLRWAQVQL